MTALHGVLVTYRRPERVAAYLRALRSQSRQLESLVVVDNDVAESARSVVGASDLPRCELRYLPAGANLGPAGGIALGMRHVLGFASEDDWLLLCDDDDPPRTADLLAGLEELATALRRRDRAVAAVGLSGTRFDSWASRCRRVADADLVGAVPCSAVGGNQLPLYSMHAVKAVGVFDERLFFGFEELEYGLRLYDRGFGVYAHGELWRREREHYGRLDTSAAPTVRLRGGTSWRRYYSLRNLLYIQRRRGRRIAAVRLAARAMAKPLVNLFRDPRLAWEHLRLNLRAVADAYRGRMGLTLPPSVQPSPTTSRSDHVPRSR